MREFGKIRYGYFGVRYLTITPEIQEEKKLPVNYGALIVKGDGEESAVLADSPAKKAGLVEGDIILEFDGKKITKDNTLAEMIAKKRIGEEAALTIRRGDAEIEVKLLLEERPVNI